MFCFGFCLICLRAFSLGVSPWRCGYWRALRVHLAPYCPPEPPSGGCYSSTCTTSSGHSSSQRLPAWLQYSTSISASPDSTYRSNLSGYSNIPDPLFDLIYRRGISLNIFLIDVYMEQEQSISGCSLCFSILPPALFAIFPRHLLGSSSSTLTRMHFNTGTFTNQHGAKQAFRACNSLCQQHFVTCKKITAIPQAPKREVPRGCHR